MSIFDIFIGIKLDEGFTDTSWWTDAVFRGLAEEGLADQALETEDDGASASQDPQFI